MQGGTRKYQYGSLIGNSPRIQNVFAFIDKAARAEIPVLIVGETGTGKELVAREIHQRSRRRTGPFVPVNTGALPKELIASELFGYARGSFTGATETKQGRFSEARKGTLFLDEISTMDEIAQTSLLRVLETHKFRQIGGKRDLSVDVRIITATNMDPRRGVREGIFRQDLLQRLQVLKIALPPLRRRKGDIKLLVPYFLDLFQQEFGTSVEGFSHETLALLRDYDWPGNVRELKNVVAQAVVMAESGQITPEYLPSRICSQSQQQDELEESSLQTLGPKAPQSLAATPLGSYPGDTLPIVAAEGLFLPLGLSLEEVERAYVLKMLAVCGNNKTLAAKRLGTSRKSLYDRLKRWGLE
ncbi:MAG TPA: sigma-54-dependent Fis family transcriptional regulator [Firmicutes bacterium]|nr:sigma-54-dependent Fis family transcriptional regulator [Bacillota bacterium]